MSGPVSSPVFVGRAGPLETLDAKLRDVVAGSGSAVLVAGESGIGKSRLIAELRERADQRGFTVMTGQCLELADGELPYAALIGALRSLSGVRSAPVDHRLAIDGLIGLLPQLLPAGDDDEIGGTQARLFEELLDALTGLARKVPILLVIEDLHWVDRSTRDFLDFLVRNARAECLVLVATYRSDELHRRHPLRPFVLELERSGQATRIDLQPFDREELRAQVTAIIGEPPEAALLDRLASRCDGNPFFVEELLAASDTRGGELPGSLRDALLLRVEALSSPARSILELAAVAERTVDHPLLASVSSLPEAEMNDGLREALAAYVLVEDTGTRGYGFRHALLREAVYDDLLASERRGLHLALAAALADRPELAGDAAGAAAEIAHHLYAAREHGPALRASVEAGLAAERVRALAEASIHYQRALELWDVVDDPGEPALDRLEVTRRAAQAEDLAGESARAIALARASLGSIDPSRDPVTAALLHERLGRYLVNGGRGEEALLEYGLAVEVMPARPATAEMARVLAALGQVLMISNRFEECMAPCEEARAIALEVGAREIEAHALNTLSSVYAYRGEFTRGVEATAEARTIAVELGSVEQVGRSYVNGSDALDQAGMVEDSIAMAEEGIDVCDGLGAARMFGDFLRSEIIGRLLRAGRWAEAEVRLGEHRPSGVTEGQVELLRGRMYAEQGRFEEAVSHVARAREILVASDAAMWIAPLSFAEATIPLLLGKPGEVIAIVDECLAGIGGGENAFFSAPLYTVGVRAAAEIAARTSADAGRAVMISRAEAFLARLDAVLEVIPAEAPPFAVAHRATSVADLKAMRDEPDAAAAWDRARSLWCDLGDTYQAADAAWRGAESILAGGGDRTVAEDLARGALEDLQTLGASATVSLAARRLRAHGLRNLPRGPRARTRENPAGLTARQIEVAVLLAAGLRNAEIADRLVISEKTVDHHVSAVLQKLEVGNREEAGAAALRLGLASDT